MLTALVLGWLLNAVIILLVLLQDKRGHTFFELAIIPYGLPVLLIAYAIYSDK